MIIETHNTHNDIDPNMTSLQGYVTADYDVLTALFGEPMDGDGYKTDAEWHLRFQPSNLVATIYNWKNGRNYLGHDGLNVQAITEWNIGGHTPLAAKMVQTTIKEALEQA